jgi:peptidoglycan/LPS O-acetylase OafA/YrhL
MTIIALGTCMVIIAAAQTQWKGPRLLAPLLLLGQRSYEVYLTHMFVVFAFFVIFVHYGDPIWAVPLLFIATVIATAAIGDIIARFFSEPLNRILRARWSGPRRELGIVIDSPEIPVSQLNGPDRSAVRPL